MHSYITTKQANYLKNTLIKNGITKIHNKIVSEAITIADNEVEDIDYDIENIASVLEYNFSDQEKKASGITFTPADLVQFMYTNVLQLNSSILTKKIADLALGNGVFFSELLFLLKKQYPSFKLVPFIENNLYGYDIKKENIYLAKLIISSICVYYGEDLPQINFNLFVEDSLIKFTEEPNNFDLIVGNPPYVKQQNIDKQYRKFLTENFDTITSNYNLYYAFIEMASNLIAVNGNVLFLVPNYLLKIKSAQALRKQLINKHMFSRIVDFGYSKMFSGVGTYSMILELRPNSNNLEFKKVDNQSKSLKKLEASKWGVKLVNDFETINLTNKVEDDLITAIQNQPYELDISTGIATQKDKLYLIDTYSFDEHTKETKYYKLYKNKAYEIESDIIMKIIKGSNSSVQTINTDRYIIYPYDLKNGKATLISHDVLKSNYPMCYQYFIDSEEDLLSRSGVNSGDDWYKYGRSQALSRINPKIVFPTNSLTPKFRYIDEPALFFNGYAIYGIKNKPFSEKDMRCLEIILNTKLIEDFMQLTSYYIGGGYVSYQKKYLSKVKIPKLDDNQKNILIELSNNKSKTESLVRTFYGL